MTCRCKDALTQWQDISTAPKTGAFLVYGGEWESEINGPAPSENIALIARASGGKFYEEGGDYYSSWISKPTHWMHLPKPPLSP